jgi:hypothetical protein
MDAAVSIAIRRRRIDGICAGKSAWMPAVTIHEFLLRKNSKL